MPITKLWHVCSEIGLIVHFVQKEFRAVVVGRVKDHRSKKWCNWAAGLPPYPLCCNYTIPIHALPSGTRTLPRSSWCDFCPLPCSDLQYLLICASSPLWPSAFGYLPRLDLYFVLYIRLYFGFLGLGILPCLCHPCVPILLAVTQQDLQMDSWH